MVSENFKTLKDLYNHVLPALKSKRRELKDQNILYITEEDIWKCLKNTKWSTKTDLTLYDIVNDILFLSEGDIINYINQNSKEVVEIKKEEKEKKEEDNIL